MLIIPTINCGDFACVAEKFKKAGEFFSGLPAEALAKEGWVQIDIADGKFTSHSTWNQPKDLEKLKINLEVHLMVENPLTVIDDWIKAGAKRIIVHIETLELKSLKAEKLKSYASDCEIGLAINPETPVENLISFLSVSIDRSRNFVQILAVNPGLSGQKFQPQVLEKIKFLKKNFPDVIIEVDGGINLKTAKLCQESGADILAVGSYIWESGNPLEAYKKLIAI
jgi:ribulose-phosphate 3-epimerase